ncbi:MAG: TlpA family protein disulfide reductase [Saprospiraceae bacterium]
MPNRFLAFALSLVSFLFFSSCITIPNKYSSVAPGYWRAVLQLDPKFQPLKTSSIKLDADPKAPFEEVSGGELPFIFEVVYSAPEKFYINIINGSERMKIEDVQIGRDKKTARDTIRINFTEYETYITAAYEGTAMEGFWVKGGKRIPFVAKQGQNHRFSTLKKKPIADLSGKWETTFGIQKENTAEQEKAIGEFEQKDNQITGTFMTETGDYRFLEGEVQANKLYLSCFDGSHAFLFEGKIMDNNNLIGSFRSGVTHYDQWEAKRNNEFKLRDEYSIATVKEGQEALQINFTNPAGKAISFDNPEYKGKVKVLQVSGTWCPNCRDESFFLTEYIKSNPDLAVIGLFFEKHPEKEVANAQLTRYKIKMKIPYETVVVGTAGKNEAAAALPMLNNFTAFPTTIFVDKDNKIRRVHTGFNGPATSQYSAFKQEFDDFVRKLQAE